MKLTLPVMLAVLFAAPVMAGDRWDRGSRYDRGSSSSSRWNSDRGYRYDRGERHYDRGDRYDRGYSRSRSSFGFSFGFGNYGFRDYGYANFGYRYGSPGYSYRTYRDYDRYDCSPRVYRDTYIYTAPSRYYDCPPPVIYRPAPRVYYYDNCGPTYYSGSTGCYYYR